MKKILFLIFSVLVYSKSLAFEYNGLQYKVLSYNEMTCMLTSTYESHYSGDIVIPAEAINNGRAFDVVEIDNSTFFFNKDITSIVIPNTVRKIQNNCFNGCSEMVSIEVPNSVTSIGTQAFAGCSKITTINIPENLEVIDNYLFMGCSSLDNVVIPNSVTSIGISAFKDCTSLKSIILPSNIALIDEFAFSGCTSLKTIFSNSINPPKLSAKNCFSDLSYETATLVVPNGVIDVYSNSYIWYNFKNVTDFDNYEAGMENIIIDNNSQILFFDIKGYPTEYRIDKPIKPTKQKNIFIVL